MVKNVLSSYSAPTLQYTNTLLHAGCDWLMWAFYFSYILYNFSFFLFFFCIFMATPSAYRSSQARGWIRAAAAVCDLHHSSQQCWIFNPLITRDRTCILVNTSRVLNPLSHNGNSFYSFSWRSEKFFKFQDLTCWIYLLVSELRIIYIEIVFKNYFVLIWYWASTILQLKKKTIALSCELTFFCIH